MEPENTTVCAIDLVRQFILRRVRLVELGDDDEIFRSGVVNSMFALQLILYVEKQFGIAIEDEDLDMVNFRTLNALAQLIVRKKSSAQGQMTNSQCP